MTGIRIFLEVYMKDEQAGTRSYPLVPMLRRGNADLTGNLTRDPSVRVCIPTREHGNEESWLCLCSSQGGWSFMLRCDRKVMRVG